ncbi:MAG: hypothetical protein IKN81_00870 [Oscillospiraceae bacterium]|nr:hypothetical protein [Oscillospiraceae bacterium]
MRIGKILTSAVLTASMLLSLLVGGVANAVNTPVALEQKAMLDPLSATEGVAYERHEAGYAVDLGREADSVTVNIAAPEAEGERAAWKARLYVDTGVELMRGVTYRVSYSLAALREQSAYDVHFDSSMAEDAYGVLYGRSVAAEGMDTVEYLLTPEAARGTLVLRLQLGMTGAEGNELRFANLKVEEASASAGNVLADQLNYGTQGNISIWTNEDSRAILVGGENSATLTVTEAPRFGAEVWKIKLLAATGLRPEAGKAYRVRADLTSTAAAEYEICYNEGDFEKGYDVQYAQQLTAGTQTIDRTIYIPTNRENAGELVLQFSLGKLAGGESVTISGIRVEEAIPAYTSVLSDDFAYNKSETTVNYGTRATEHTTDAGASVNWGGLVVEKSGQRANALTVESNNAVKLSVGTQEDDNGTYTAKLHILAGKLTAEHYYRVSFKIASPDAPYSEYEILYGSVLHGDGKDNDTRYGVLKQRSLTGEDTVEYLFKADETDRDLVVTLQLGKTDSTKRDVTVSEFSLTDLGTDPATVPVLSTNAFTVQKKLDNADVTDVGTADSNGTGGVSYQTETDADAGNGWKNRLYIHPAGVSLTPGESYRVRFDMQTDTAINGANLNLLWGKGVSVEDHVMKAYGGGEYNLTLEANKPYTYETRVTAAEGKTDLAIAFQMAGVAQGTRLTFSNVRVEKINTTVESDNLVSGSFSYSDTGTDYFEPVHCEITARDDANHSVSLTCQDGGSRKLYMKNIAMLDVNKTYKISYQISVGAETVKTYNALYQCSGTVDSTWSRFDKAFGDRYGLPLSTQTETVAYYTRPTESGRPLELQLELDQLDKDTVITISNLTVQEVTLSDNLGAGVTSRNLDGSVYAETPIADYEATLTRSGSQTVFDVSKAPNGGDAWKDFNARVFLRTGFSAAADKTYRVSFDLKAAKAQNKVVVLYGGNEGDKAYGEQYDWKFAENETKNITCVIPANKATGDLIVQLNLGEIDQTTGNTFTVSHLKVEEITYTYSTVQTGSHTKYTSYCDVQPGYRAETASTEDAAAIALTEVPAEGTEPWKAKLFIDTGIRPQVGETYRVTLDASADKDQDFEICYNRDGDEKGFDAIYALHVAAGDTKTVERVFTAESSGELIVQLSVGNAVEPNTIRAGGLKVERITYTYTDQSALPAALSYRTQTAVDFWAHEDYTAALTGTADAATVNISKAPASGAEAWKAKLFVHTGAVLRAGGFYKVTANLSAAAAQDVDVCYNNADAEKGYGELNGVRIAKGETRTVEKLLYVSPTREDLKALTLQFNLGNAANQITVSGVKVEEVPVSLRDAMPKALNYSSAVRRQLDGGYASTIERAADTATLHLTRVPRSGAESWKAKLYVSTGARLAAGKTYLVTANVLASQTMDYELCFNAGQREKGYDALYGQRAEAGAVNRIERLITVPARGASGELILQFSVGSSPAANDITVSGVSVRELAPGAAKAAVKSDFSLAAVTVSEATENASGILTVSHKKLAYEMTKISAEAGENELAVIGAGLCAGETYAVSFTARADKGMTGEFALCRADGETVAILKSIPLSSAKQTYSFVTDGAIAESGMYELRWRFGSAQNQSLGSATVELSDIHLSIPAQQVSTVRSEDSVTVDGEEAAASVYAIDGCNYFKLRDAAALLSGTKAQFGVQYVEDRNAVAITTGDAYEPVGGELTDTGDLSAQLMRTPQSVEVDGKETYLKAYGIGGYNYFRIRDLAAVLGFGVDYDGQTRTVVITSTKE